jgi:hypothetical protein
MSSWSGIEQRAAANWLLDAACLWICLGAYGAWRSPGPLLAIYAATMLLSWLPITPGGLGIVEGTLVSALISFGSDPGAALREAHVAPG